MKEARATIGLALSLELVLKSPSQQLGRPLVSVQPSPLVPASRFCSYHSFWLLVFARASDLTPTGHETPSSSLSLNLKGSRCFWRVVLYRMLARHLKRLLLKNELQDFVEFSLLEGLREMREHSVMWQSLRKLDKNRVDAAESRCRVRQWDDLGLSFAQAW